MDHAADCPVAPSLAQVRAELAQLAARVAGLESTVQGTVWRAALVVVATEPVVRWLSGLALAALGPGS